MSFSVWTAFSLLLTFMIGAKLGEWLSWRKADRSLTRITDGYERKLKAVQAAATETSPRTLGGMIDACRARPDVRGLDPMWGEMSPVGTTDKYFVFVTSNAEMSGKAKEALQPLFNSMTSVQTVETNITVH